MICNLQTLPRFIPFAFSQKEGVDTFCMAKFVVFNESRSKFVDTHKNTCILLYFKILSLWPRTIFFDSAKCIGKLLFPFTNTILTLQGQVLVNIQTFSGGYF